MDIATANNTVAIVMAAPIAKEISNEYGIGPKKTASLWTFSVAFVRDLFHMSSDVDCS